MALPAAGPWSAAQQVLSSSSHLLIEATIADGKNEIAHKIITRMALGADAICGYARHEGVKD
jgi:hypothetical protein